MTIRMFLLAAAAWLFSATAYADEEPGIQIHGRWTLEVLSPDGQPVERYEFNNALVNPAAVTTLLNRDGVSSGFYVVLTNQMAITTGTGPCNPDCEITEPSANIGITPESTNLTMTQTGTNFETLRLAGSITVSNTSSIDLVQTWVGLCNGTTNNTTQCFANPDSHSVFTSRVLSTAINVTAGQIVQVTVDLTVS